MSKHFYGINDFLSAQSIQEGRTLVVGSKVYGKEEDRRKLYQNAEGLDMEEGIGVDHVHNLEYPLEGFGTFDHIDLVSVMEHVQRPWLMAENIVKLMNPGASILIQAPFSWRVHNYPGDYWRYTTGAYKVLFPEIKWKVLGYLSDSQFTKITPRLNHQDKVYIQRSEAIGFGYRIS